MKSLFPCAALLAVLSVGSGVWADAIALDTTAGSNVTGNPSSAPGFSDSSWQSTAVGVGAKSELYIPVAALFNHPVLISDIASISFWTNKPGNSGAPDWTLLLYTNTTGSGDAGSFYHSRLNAEPYFTNTSTIDDPANAWHLWSTNDPSNPLRFYDSVRSGAVGTYTDPTLAQITSGSVTWNGAGESGTSHNYSGESIKYFSLQTGTPWANGFTGLVDGLTITLTNNEVGSVNLEATPLPSVASMGYVMFAALCVGGIVKSRRKLA